MDYEQLIAIFTKNDCARAELLSRSIEQVGENWCRVMVSICIVSRGQTSREHGRRRLIRVCVTFYTFWKWTAARLISVAHWLPTTSANEAAHANKVPLHMRKWTVILTRLRAPTSHYKQIDGPASQVATTGWKTKPPQHAWAQCFECTASVHIIVLLQKHSQLKVIVKGQNRAHWPDQKGKNGDDPTGRPVTWTGQYLVLDGLTQSTHHHGPTNPLIISKHTQQAARGGPDAVHSPGVHKGPCQLWSRYRLFQLNSNTCRPRNGDWVSEWVAGTFLE